MRAVQNEISLVISSSSSLRPSQRHAARFIKVSRLLLFIAVAAILGASAPIHAQTQSLGTKIAEYVQTPAELNEEYYDATCYLTDFCTNFPPNPVGIKWSYTLTPAEIKKVKGHILALTAAQTSYYIDDVGIDNLKWVVDGVETPPTTTNAFSDGTQFGYQFSGGLDDTAFFSTGELTVNPPVTHCSPYCWTGQIMTLNVPANVTTLTVSGCFPCNGNTESGVELYLNVVLPGLVANLNGGKDEKAVVSTPVTATFPLGGDFTLALLDSQGKAVPATYDFGSPSFSENIAQGALFPNSVAFQYSQPVSGRGAFHAAHLGNVTLTITPKDSQSPVAPATLTVAVVNPASLGTSDPEVDPLIYPIADLTGIPPNFIKAQMAQESGNKFNPMAYRYEPLSHDERFISRGEVKKGGDLRVGQFKAYRFETVKDSLDLALPQGIRTDSDDLATLNNFPAVGSNPTALHIVNAYDSVENWRSQPGGEGHYQALLKSDFTAQTSLAASYGYMQITYATAIQVMHWKGVSGMKDPSLLFDTDANMNNGGGSLILGNRYLQGLFSSNNPGVASSPSLQLAGPKELVNDFNPAWLGYNGHTDYPGKVGARIPTYRIVAAGSIF